MAIAIKSIPVLKEKDAVNFVKKADNAMSSKATVDFNKQVQVAKAILKKAKIG